VHKNVNKPKFEGKFLRGHSMEVSRGKKAQTSGRKAHGKFYHEKIYLRGMS
jgi:hypothetical protein